MQPKNYESETFSDSFSNPKTIRFPFFYETSSLTCEVKTSENRRESIISRPQVMENYRQCYLLLRKNILPKIVVGCHCFLLAQKLSLLVWGQIYILS